MPKSKAFTRIRGTAVMAAMLPLLVASCDQGPRSGYGFALPDGDAERGQATFARLGCSDCHVIEDRPELRSGVEPLMSVPLGGKTPRIRTYGDLVTSIINPSHRISHRYRDVAVADDGGSAMRNYNDVMTVATLVDLVAFLQGEYEVYPPAGPSYQTYTYPPPIESE